MHLICREKLGLEAILWDKAQLMKSQCNSLWCLWNIQLRRLNKGVKFKGVLTLERIFLWPQGRSKWTKASGDAKNQSPPWLLIFSHFNEHVNIFCYRFSGKWQVQGGGWNKIKDNKFVTCLKEIIIVYSTAMNLDFPLPIFAWRRDCCFGKRGKHSPLHIKQN